MSTNQPERSDRAKGGVADLRADVLDWLKARGPLTDRLEWVDSIADGEGASVIRPETWLRRAERGTGELPDIVLTVGVYTSNGTRDNHQTEKTHSGQVMLSLRERAAKRLPGQWDDEVRDEVTAVLTRHREGWYSPTVPGGDTGLRWNDNRNREEMVVSFDMTYWG